MRGIAPKSLSHKREVVLLATHAMGTRFELVLVGEDPIHLRAAGEEALREIQHWHDRLSRFTPDSDITRLNHNPRARIDPDLADLLALAEDVRLASNGAFDAHTGPDRFLDLGAIAKGFALDRAAAILQDCGIHNALLHGGTSSIIALDSPPSAPLPLRGASSLPWASAHRERESHTHASEGRQSGWPIQLASSGAPLNLILHNQALGISSTRFRDHILNPSTLGTAHPADTAAIIAPLSTPNAAALADAWSTALIVLGQRPATLPDHFTSHIHTPTHGWTSHTPTPSFRPPPPPPSPPPPPPPPRRVCRET
mgnify:CR=1 FL=1